MKSKKEKSENKQTLADLVFDIADSCQFFRDQYGQPCVSFAHENRKYTDIVCGTLFRSWLRAVLHRNFDFVPTEAALSGCLQTLEGRVTFDASLTDEIIHLRTAQVGENICIDLADSAGKTVVISGSGWEVTEACPVKFRRNAHCRPLPEPERGGSIHEIRPLLNVESESDWILMAGYLASVLRPNVPYPVLVLSGEQGSAKSTATKLIKALLDPSSGSNACLPRNGEEMFVLANNSHLLTFNNTSSISKDMSDIVCSISTGGEIVKRKLFTNSDLSAMHAIRPVIVNGIGDFVTRPDLVDRSLQIQLPTIPADRRTTEDHIAAEFHRIKGRILGAIFDAMSCAIRNLSKVPAYPLPRMADFTLWAMASMIAFGYSPEAFLEAYRKNISRAVQTTFDQDLLAVAVVRLISEERVFWGTASELANLLYERSTVVDRKLLPTGHSIRNELRRIEPLLRHAGISMALNPKRTETVRPLLICKTVDKESVISVISDIVDADDIADKDDATDKVW